MKLVVLGTGHGKSINCYNTCFVLKTSKENLLVDCGGGNGILTQFSKAHIQIEEIRNIFISHSHIDHLLGIIWIIRYLCPKYHNNLIKKSLNIYGNEDVINVIKNLITLFIPGDFNSIICNNFHFNVVKDGTTIKIFNGNLTFFDKI